MGGIVTRLLYPAPSPSDYGPYDFPPGSLVWVPRDGSAGSRASSSKPRKKSLFATGNSKLKQKKPKSTVESVETEHPLPCLIARPHPRDRSRARWLVLYAHGNGCDIGSVYQEMLYLASELGVYFLAFEYRGYGLSPGPASEPALNNDMKLAFQYATGALGVDPSRIVLWGCSLGSGICTNFAAKQGDAGKPLGGLVLQAPYRSIMAVVRDLAKVVPETGAWPSWRSEDRIRRVCAPVLLVHGEKDGMIGISHSRVLLANCERAASAVLRACPTSTHNTWNYEQELVPAVRTFLAKIDAESKRRRRALDRASSAPPALAAPRPTPVPGQPPNSLEKKDDLESLARELAKVDPAADIDELRGAQGKLDGFGLRELLGRAYLAKIGAKVSGSLRLLKRAYYDSRTREWDIVALRQTYARHYGPKSTAQKSSRASGSSLASPTNRKQRKRRFTNDDEVAASSKRLRSSEGLTVYMMPESNAHKMRRLGYVRVSVDRKLTQPPQWAREQYQRKRRESGKENRRSGKGSGVSTGKAGKRSSWIFSSLSSLSSISSSMSSLSKS